MGIQYGNTQTVLSFLPLTSSEARSLKNRVARTTTKGARNPATIRLIWDVRTSENVALLAFDAGSWKSSILEVWLATKSCQSLENNVRTRSCSKQPRSYTNAWVKFSWMFLPFTWGYSLKPCQSRKQLSLVGLYEHELDSKPRLSLAACKPRRLRWLSRLFRIQMALSQSLSNFTQGLHSRPPLQNHNPSQHAS